LPGISREKYFENISLEDLFKSSFLFSTFNDVFFQIKIVLCSQLFVKPICLLTKLKVVSFF